MQVEYSLLNFAENVKKMKNQKNIEMVVAPPAPHFVGDGFRVHNFIPRGYHLDMPRMNPFLVLDYNSKFHFTPQDTPRGVGVHPHKGFETVTIAYKGSISHQDSSGGGGTIGEGDVQWMTAASGLLHKEFHSEEFSKTGGDFQMIQLWVNLPAKDKKAQPKYQAISKNQMGTYEWDKENRVEVIAGEYLGIKGPAQTFTPVNLMNVRLKAGKKADFSFDADFTTFLLVVEGAIKVNQTDSVPTDHLALFENEGEQFTIEATEDALVLVASGKPINEPIVAHGPFVMNTQKEILEAFEDFNMGKFGYLE